MLKANSFYKTIIYCKRFVIDRPPVRNFILKKNSFPNCDFISRANLINEVFSLKNTYEI